ncbi:MAG: carbohydrate binding domain-containing protein [Phycisphaeraceae bacterium]|nr:carbohydrate binding domain-containing protein [Phycisphaeraceae bacterium]
MKFLRSSHSYHWALVLLLSATAFGGEQLKNPHFKKGFSNWPLYIHPNLKPSTTRKVGEGVLTITNNSPDKPQHVQLSQVITLEEGQKYKLSFKAKREGAEVKTRVLCVQKSKTGFSNGLDKTITVSKKWSEHTLIFTATRIDAKVPSILRIFLGNQNTISFREFSLTKVTASAVKKSSTATSTYKGPQPFRIIPTPRELTLGEGEFQLAQTLFIQSNRSFSTGLLEREVSFITGRSKGCFKSTTSESEVPFLCVSNTASVDLMGKTPTAPPYPGGYTLAILPDGIAIKGHDDEGLNNGIQSFLQVLEQHPNGTVPQLNIVDMPTMEFRAMHLILRPPYHWGKKTVAEVLDIYRWIFRRLGRYKYNNVCLMIKGELKLKKNPQVWPNATFTHEQVRQFLDVAAEHNLAVFQNSNHWPSFSFTSHKKLLKLMRT